MSELRLLEAIHPVRDGEANFQALFGIEDIKEALIDELALILDRDRLKAWGKAHHPHGVGILEATRSTLPLVLLSGDVGCGKTALASCVATPVARLIDQRIACLETPSDIRGGGHVGELSARVTNAFEQARAKANEVGRAILIIDEADDLATGRSQTQAHHEDRAGVNVLIKQINMLAANPAPIALIMITNRPDVLDPAVMRRAALQLVFTRPNDEARLGLFRRLLSGTNTNDAQLKELVRLTAKNPGYTYSDLTDRIGRLALRRAVKTKRPLGFELIAHAIAATAPTPLLG